MTPTPNQLTREQFTRLRAAALKVGVRIHESAYGGYLVARWTMSIHLPTASALVDWLARQGIR